MREITSEAELRALLGLATPQAAGKDRARLHELDRAWIAASPYVLMATSSADGTCDVSPRGDPAGATVVLDDRTLALPERPGNRRGDGLLNLLANPHVGLMYLVPGRGDALRVAGRARVVQDAPSLDDPRFDAMVVRGHRPVLAVVVDVEQVFFHCSKAALRAGLWDPASWRPDAVASRPVIAQTLERPEADIEELERYYGPSYADKLYRS